MQKEVNRTPQCLKILRSLPEPVGIELIILWCQKSANRLHRFLSSNVPRLQRLQRRPSPQLGYRTCTKRVVQLCKWVIWIQTLQMFRTTCWAKEVSPISFLNRPRSRRKAPPYRLRILRPLMRKPVILDQTNSRMLSRLHRSRSSPTITHRSTLPRTST